MDTYDNLCFEYEDEAYFYLYKHLKLDEYTLKIISEGTISFTNPNNFNDPFDCFYDISEDYFHTATEVSKYYLKKISPAKRIYNNQISKNKLKIDIENGSYYQDIHKRTGVCCLNQNPLNILMWSHYANHHKGFMVEFKFPKLLNNLFKSLGDFYPFPVTYTTQLPKITKQNRSGEKDAIENIESIYLTKSSVWSYEKELRVIATNLDSPIQKYPRDEILCSVILGLKSSLEDEERVHNLAEEVPFHLPVYRAKKIKGQYSIYVPSHPRLDVLAKCKEKK